jgi:hypothetical protein
MLRTTNKGIRFTDAELERIEKLRAQLPEYSSEADLLHHAALLGILVLATYATRPDHRRMLAMRRTIWQRSSNRD